MIKNIIQKIVHFFTIFLIALSFILMFIAIFKKEWIEAFIEWMKEISALLGAWNYLIAGLSSFIEAFPVIGVVVPGQNILLIAGGFFGAAKLKNLFYVITIASLGAIIGNYVGYLLGKYYGDSFFKKYGLWFGIGLTEVKYLKKGIHKWGPAGIILGKFHPMTRAFLPFIAGSMGMNSIKFMMYNIIGSIIRAFAIIILGVVFVTYYEIILDYFGYLMFGIFSLVGLYIYKFKKKEFLQYLKEKDLEMQEIGKK